LKAGRYAVVPAPPGMRPDLSGLSCRWQPVRARAGVMLSLVVRRGSGVADDLFHEAVGQILDLIAREMPGRNPVSDASLKFGSPLTGFALEAKVEGVTGYRRLKLFLWRVMSWVIVRGRLRAGGFNPLHYRDQTVRNSDFRKFHDGLDMTLDCTQGQAETIKALLDNLAGKGVIRFGTHRQQEALMTCIVPSYTADDHLHFIDGAGGGYAEAARRLKAMK
ncbi:MAG: DUF3095 family protein, partial [Alphaproteobacteria bacterium]